MSDLLSRVDRYLNEGEKYGPEDSIIATIDFAGSNSQLKTFMQNANKYADELSGKVISKNGPGGGWPEVEIKGQYDAVFKFLKKHYEPSLTKSDFNAFID